MVLQWWIYHCAAPACIVAYFGAEGSWLHSHWRVEAAFWIVVCLAFAFEASMLFPASMLPQITARKAASIGFIAAAIWSGLNKGRRRRRAMLPFKPAEHAVVGPSPQAQGDLEWVKDSIDRLTRADRLCSGFILARLHPSSWRWVSETRAHLQFVFERASADALNYLIASTNLPRLLEVLDKSTMEILYQKRLPEMTTLSRSALLNALMQTGCRHRLLRQQFAVNVLLATRGKELTLLKSLIDSGGDAYSVHRLIYYEMESEHLRNKVVEHIMREGGKVRLEEQYFQQDKPTSPMRSGEAASCSALPKLCAEPSKRCKFAGTIKVLSDIDDTLQCSGGKFPAGFDERLPHGAVYPGVLQLYRELSCGSGKEMYGSANQSNSWSREDTGDSSYADSESEQEIERQFSERQIASKLALNPRQSSPESHDFVAKLRTSPSASPSRPSNSRQTSSDGFFTGLQSEGRQASASSTAIEERRRRPNSLVFLSARPHVYKRWTEQHFFRRVATPLVNSGGVDAMPGLLPGSFQSGMASMWRGFQLLRWAPDFRAEMWRELGLHKFKTFQEYMKLYPECDFCFVGDNGQGDLLAAELMAEESARLQQKAATLSSPARVLCCLVHAVQDMELGLSTHESCSLAERQARWRHGNILLGSSYVKLALEAYLAGILDADAVTRVANATENDLQRLCARHPSGPDYAQIMQECSVLAEEVQDVRERLREDLATEQV